jgi:choline-sulfatase
MPPATLDRRRFLGAAAALAAASRSASARAACPTSPALLNLKRRDPALADLTGGRQPNILFILTDQERCARNLPPTLVRPHWNGLRQNAVCFSGAFTCYPLCSPSRSAIMTGQYPHRNGVTQNVIFPVGKGVLDPAAPHLGSVLASAGYRLGYKGKWDLSRGPTYYTANLKDRGRAGDYGFEGHGGKVPDQEYAINADDQVVRESCAWVRQAANDPGRPWFLCCSIINPHDICHPQLKPDLSIRPDVVLPASLHDDLAAKPADQRWNRDSRFAHFNQVLHPEAKPFGKYTENDWRLFLSFYYDLIEKTDRHLGDLLAALDDSGQRRNTIVVYSSDHGELGGAHGFSGKNQGYEEDLHVPLLFSHPGLDPAVTPELVSNISIAPTIAALAGADWPAPIPGRDLSPRLRGEALPAADCVFAETESRVNVGVYRHYQAMRMIRTGRYKYSFSFYDVKDGQLYDLEQDPAEMVNLFRDPAHAALRRELEDRLRAWQRETNDRFILP